MQRFFQSSCRCKDLLLNMKNHISSCGWSIVDQNFSDIKQWFIAQKLSSNGLVITAWFSDIDFPSQFGRVGVGLSYTNTLTVNNDGVYVGAYDPITKTLKNVRNPAYPYYHQDINVDTSNNTELLRYNSGVQDSDDSPSHVFYIMTVEDDWIFIRLRGNPAVSGHTRTQIYLGTFEKLSDDILNLGPKGIWGAWSSMSRTLFCTVVPESPNLSVTDWYVSGNVSRVIFDRNQTLDGVAHPVPSYDNGNMLVPQYLIENNHIKFPQIYIPTDRILAIGRSSTLIDENNFIEYNGDKYLYTHIDGNWGQAIKAIVGVKEIEVLDTGSSYQIKWRNPNSDAIKTIKLFAKLNSPINAIDESGVFLVATISNPILNSEETYSDSVNYNQTVYYTLISYDDASQPNSTILSKKATSKIGPNIAIMDRHITRFNLSNTNYKFTNKHKMDTFHSPLVSYKCDDNESNPSVKAFAGEYKVDGVANANTNTLTTSGVLSNGFNLSNDKSFYIPASDMLICPSSFTIQAWLKKPTDWAYWGASRNWCGFNDHHTIAIVDLDGNTIRHHISNSGAQSGYIWDDENWRFIQHVTSGGDTDVFTNNEYSLRIKRVLDDTHNFGANNLDFYIGRGNSTGNYWLGAINGFEFFKYALSKIQREYSWNNGNGRMYDPVDFGGFDYLDGASFIMKSDAIGESVSFKIPDEPGFSNNLSGINTLNFDVFTTSPNTVFKLILTNSSNEDLGYIIDMGSSEKVWSTKSIDLSGVPNESKKNIHKITLEMLSAVDYQVISIKNFIKAN